MAVAPLTGSFRQAKGYSRGRNNGPVLWLVLHSAEGARTVPSLGNYFAGTTAGSSNSGIDDTEYGEFVTYNNTPWTNPPINSRSDTVELCAFKAWSRAEWLKHPKMLEQAAHWIAWRAAVRQIPIRLITGADAVAGRKGVLDHARVNDGFAKSDHTDVGDGFPWDRVIARAQQIAGIRPAAAANTAPYGKTPRGDRILGLHDPVLRGPDVAGVQNALRLAGNNIVIDGIYDRQTADLINVFKTNRRINERGVGELTWAALRAVPGVH